MRIDLGQYSPWILLLVSVVVSLVLDHFQRKLIRSLRATLWERDRLIEGQAREIIARDQLLARRDERIGGLGETVMGLHGELTQFREQSERFDARARAELAEAHTEKGIMYAELTELRQRRNRGAVAGRR
jgi:hypothetical protein